MVEWPRFGNPHPFTGKHLSVQANVLDTGAENPLCLRSDNNRDITPWVITCDTCPHSHVRQRGNDAM